jgi:hypothetical protein
MGEGIAVVFGAVFVNSVVGVAAPDPHAVRKQADMVNSFDIFFIFSSFALSRAGYFLDCKRKIPTPQINI